MVGEFGAPVFSTTDTTFPYPDDVRYVLFGTLYDLFAIRDYEDGDYWYQKYDFARLDFKDISDHQLVLERLAFVEKEHQDALAELASNAKN
jgi:hypothetical protein